jgi:phospho-N-acetylmuramoyl-pentapeptide-transferase
MVAWLERRFRAPLKTESQTLARLQAAKHATPTMGGLFILTGITLSLALCSDWTDARPRIAFIVVIGFGAIGAVDDLIKLRPNGQGLRAGPKFLAQLAVGVVVAGLLIQLRPSPLALEAWLPDCGALKPWLLTAWATLVILSSSNAVNLADGLDGLAGGTIAMAAACLGLIAWLATKHSTDGMEICVLAGGMLGSVLGFLRFNRHPARVFMGDTGSLPLGALLGFMALAIGNEILWIVIGGVFVAEAISVMLQVGWFKWRRQRLFRCAPLHHHFQFLGWPEQKIVARFWLASLLCALTALTLVLLPLRAGLPTDKHPTLHMTTASRAR